MKDRHSAFWAWVIGLAYSSALLGFLTMFPFVPQPWTRGVWVVAWFVGFGESVGTLFVLDRLAEWWDRRERMVSSRGPRLTPRTQEGPPPA